MLQWSGIMFKLESFEESRDCGARITGELHGSGIGGELESADQKAGKTSHRQNDAVRRTGDSIPKGATILQQKNAPEHAGNPGGQRFLPGA